MSVTCCAVLLCSDFDVKVFRHVHVKQKLNRYHLIAVGNYVILRDNIRIILLSALLSPSEPAAAMSPLFLLALGSLLASAASAQQQQLGLDIFYESLCPDSTR